jgi:hypothetical protein
VEGIIPYLKPDPSPLSGVRDAILNYNARSRPFAWTATADDIIAMLGRLVISETLH